MAEVSLREEILALIGTIYNPFIGRPESMLRQMFLMQTVFIFNFQYVKELFGVIDRRPLLSHEHFQPCEEGASAPAEGL